MTGERPLAGVLATLAARGVDVWYEGERLRFHAPKGALDAEHRALISSQRSDVIAALREAAAARTEELPLSCGQFEMWFAHQQAPASAACTIGFALRASGPIQVGALRHAVQALVDRHAALRTTYHLTNDGLIQRVAGAAEAVLEVHTVAGLAAADQDAPWLRARIAADIARPFDLETGPVMRAGLFTDGNLAHIVLLSVHHIANDAWSTKQLIAEFLTLYGEAAENRPARLPRPQGEYADFVRWQERELGSALGERQWDYWQRVLAAPRQRTVLPADIERPAVRTFAGDSIQFDLPAGVYQRVQTIAARERTTPFVFLLGSFQLLLARLCGVHDVITGTPALGRPKTEFQSVVGDFVNVLPIRSRLDDRTTVSVFLAQLHETVVGALDAQDYPLSRLVQRLHPEREATGQALFNTSFTMLTADGGTPNGDRPAASGVANQVVAGTSFAVYPLLFGAGLLDLSVDIHARETGIGCIVKYSTDILTAAAADGIAKQYVAIIQAMTGAPDQMLGVLIRDTGDRVAANTALGARPGDDVRAATLLASLAARDVRLVLDGDRLRVNAPKGALDEQAKKSIAALRPQIVARLRAGTMDAWKFWRAQLAGLPAELALPTDRPRSDRHQLTPSQARHRYIAHDVPEALLERLTAVGEAADATLFATMMAAWQVLLHRYCGQDDVVVGTRAAERQPSSPDRVAPSGASGAFGDVIPVRGRLEGNPAFDQVLQQMRKTIAEVFAQPLPIDALTSMLSTDGAHRHVSLTQVRFELESRPSDALPDSDAPSGDAPSGASRDGGSAPDGQAARDGGPAPKPRDGGFDLSLTIAPVDAADRRETRQFRYGFATDLFEPETVDRLHENFVTLLSAIAANPTTPILDFGLLGPAEERRRVRDGGGGSVVAHDRSRCVHHLLEASAQRHPGRIAVTGPGGTLSYAALDARANQLARHLVRSGVQPGALVAVCLERTVLVPIALAAVLKAGAAYVPLDPTHPPDRLRGILRDAGATCLITEAGFALTGEGTAARVVRLDADAAEIAACSDAPLGVAVRPDDLAYVIYTSGSTGRPKGVEVEHRNVVAFLEAMRRRPGLTADDVLLAVTTISFDIAGLELWLPLSVGARIVLAARAEAVDGARLAAMLEAHAVTVLQATPATWRLLLESGWAGRPKLRALCGGEGLPQALAARLIDRVGALWNMYGPTETTIWSTTSEITEASVRADSGPVPIGRPIANTSVRVVDRVGNSVPAGVIGELLIGGEGVARGYRGQPELTARAFVTHAVDGVPARMYRTGDMARFRADGQLEFLGRRDHQIKLRGHRIELSEIESVLATHAGVSGSVVTAHAPMPGDERLVAYVTLAPAASFDADAARVALRARLPDYMVPSHFMVLPAFPLTPNGKVDRAALPRPEAPQADLAENAPSLAADVPMTQAQRQVAELWRDVLRVGRVGLHDNFFDLGGHSLLLVRIQAGLKREFGVDLPLVELFERTTVAQQADRLSLAASGAAADVLQRARARAERQLHA